jgi:cytochrome c5
MYKVVYPFLTLALIGLSGCYSEGNEQQASEGSNGSASYSWRDHQYKLGQDIFNEVCAECHDKGKGAAPAIGDRESWVNRSPLWSAVLLQHAKNGYLDMPAKGGEPGLSDSEVEAAGEYMLSVTFPELPRD